MASDDKKTKAPAPKSDAPKKDKSASDAKSTADATSTPDAAPAKAEGGGKEDGAKEAGSPASYHRGEGQKPVSQAYRDNWELIYGKKKR